MTDRVVVHHDVLLALLGVSREGAGNGSAAQAARTAMASWIEAGSQIVVAASAWPMVLDELRGSGWSAAEMAEAIHALDGVDLVTIEADRPTHLLVADAMERHGLSAHDAECAVLGDLLDAPVAALRPAVAAAAGRGIALGLQGSGQRALPPARTPGSSGLPDYHGLGAFLAELRRRSADGWPAGPTATRRPGAAPRVVERRRSAPAIEPVSRRRS